MGLLPDTQDCGLRMRRECRERFPRHRLQRKPLVSDPDMHHGTCIAHVPWCMSGSLTRDGDENVPGIPGACATHKFAYLVRGPWGKEWNIKRCVLLCAWNYKIITWVKSDLTSVWWVCLLWLSHKYLYLHRFRTQNSELRHDLFNSTMYKEGFKQV